MTGSWRWLFLLLSTAWVSCAPKKVAEHAIQPKVSDERPVGVAEKGKSLFTTCKTCHGDSGQGSSQLHAPALVNLDGWYLYKQLMNFKKGIRGYLQEDTLGIQMAAIAKTLPDSIAVSNLVAYIETLPEISSQTALAGDIKKGERTYQSTCGSCHGANGKGNEAMHAPRLNGLDDWYLKSQITKFRSSLRGAHPEDRYGAQMVPMATLLRDDQAIDNVIAYIRSAKPVAP